MCVGGRGGWSKEGFNIKRFGLIYFIGYFKFHLQMIVKIFPISNAIVV